VLVESFDDVDAESLKSAAEYLLETLTDPAAVVLGSCPGEGKVSLVAAFSPSVVDQGLQAGKFIGQIAKLCGGGGGGRPNFAQAGGRKPENLSSALDKARSELMATLNEKGSWILIPLPNLVMLKPWNISIFIVWEYSTNHKIKGSEA